MSANAFAELLAGEATLHCGAETYVSANISVFPLRPNDKLPLFPKAHPKGDPLEGKCRGECGRLGHGFHDATVDLGTIREWWDRYPNANIGIRPWPRIAAVDVDVAGGKLGHATLDALGAKLGPLPDTWIAETATGGLHIWLDVGDTTRVNKALGPGIDIKVGRTGYLVAPTSRRPMGTYRWRNAEPGGLPPGLPATAPETWRQAICKPPTQTRTTVGVQPPAGAGHNPHWVHAAVSGELTKLADATPHGPKGTGRNDTLAAVSRRLYELAKGGHVDRAAADNEMRRIITGLGMSDAEFDQVTERAWVSVDSVPVPSPRLQTNNTTFEAPA